tara:strand:- start:245 stop:448 length:204 start_codon:yes stop_codon:yes gene_type:complete
MDMERYESLIDIVDKDFHKEVKELRYATYPEAKRYLKPNVDWKVAELLANLDGITLDEKKVGRLDGS